MHVIFRYFPKYLRKVPNGCLLGCHNAFRQSCDVKKDSFPTVRVTVQPICHMGLHSTAGTLPRAWLTSHVPFSLDPYGITRHGWPGHIISTYFLAFYLISWYHKNHMEDNKRWKWWSPIFSQHCCQIYSWWLFEPILWPPHEWDNNI